MFNCICTSCMSRQTLVRYIRYYSCAFLKKIHICQAFILFYSYVIFNFLCVYECWIQTKLSIHLSVTASVRETKQYNIKLRQLQKLSKILEIELRVFLIQFQGFIRLRRNDLIVMYAAYKIWTRCYSSCSLCSISF